MLLAKGFPVEEVLKYPLAQIELSRIGRNASRWVHRHLGPPGLSWRARRRLIALISKYACLGERRAPSRIISGVDIYHSPLAPIPKTVRANSKIKHFLTIHDLLGLKIPQYLNRSASEGANQLLRSLIPESFVFCVSESVKADVVEFSTLPPERVFVSPLAADRTIFYKVTDRERIARTRSLYNLRDAPYLLTLSSFDPRKNFGHIIHCFSELVRSRRLVDCNLLIVGSNPERNLFVSTAIARNADIRSRILMPGFIPDEHLAAIYSDAVGFLFPSFGEGFGLPVLEAMQCGTPVISSNTTSLPEVVEDAGILLNPTDVDGWCQAIIDIVERSTVRSDLGIRGINRASHFSWDKFINVVENGYSTARSER